MSSPRIWTKFSRKVNGKEVKFRIQEVGSEYYETVFKFYLDYYTPEEAIHKAAGVMKSVEAIEEYKKQYLRPCVSEECQIDVCCVDNESDNLDIVGASIMHLDEKSQPWNGKETLNLNKTQLISENIDQDNTSVNLNCDNKQNEDNITFSSNLLKTEPMKIFFKMAVYMSNVFYRDFREKLNTDVFYDDVGIVVRKDYRGLGLAGELLKAREVICKEHGVPALGAWMTSMASQKAASKLGWETVLELTYEDIGRIGDVIYEESVPTAKYMTKKVI